LDENFKAKIALEALQGDEKITEIADNVRAGPCLLLF
jgi:hypothetical protein